MRPGPHPQGRHRCRLGGDQGSQRPRIHTFISTSDIHIEHQLQTDREDVKGQARAAVTLAKSYCDDVEFSPMDATRADIEFTAEVCAIAVEEGATVVNIPDTVGYTTPEERLIKIELCFANPDKVRRRIRDRTVDAKHSELNLLAGFHIATDDEPIRRVPAGDDRTALLTKNRVISPLTHISA